MLDDRDPLVACAQCGEETHGVYWTSFWQVTHQTIGANPDGTSIKSMPTAATTCSRKCLVEWLTHV